MVVIAVVIAIPISISIKLQVINLQLKFEIKSVIAIKNFMFTWLTKFVFNLELEVQLNPNLLMKVHSCHLLHFSGHHPNLSLMPRLLNIPQAALNFKLNYDIFNLLPSKNFPFSQ
jgi:hypothetical protein